MELLNVYSDLTLPIRIWKRKLVQQAPRILKKFWFWPVGLACGRVIHYSVPKTSRSLNTVRHHASDLCFHVDFYAILAKAVFYEIALMFLVRQVSMKWFIGVKFLSYWGIVYISYVFVVWGSVCRWSRIFFFEVILFSYRLVRHWCGSVFIPNFTHGLLSFTCISKKVIPKWVRRMLCHPKLAAQTTQTLKVSKWRLILTYV